MIEERKRLANNPALSDEERKRLDKALKVLANATSYGIFAEMRRQDTAKKTPVTCYGIDPDPFSCEVPNPEHAGAYCFPPLASLITVGGATDAGAARTLRDRSGRHVRNGRY